jgi:Methylase involved in ubiquinone/menaquinone biosynthesis
MGLRDLSAFLPLLACPICYLPFAQEQQVLHCPNGHAFDLAHEGYVNLLRKQLPGDTKEMLLARRAVFSQGFYQPLSDTLHTLLLTHLRERATLPTILRCFDAGCGEGYYLGRLHEALLATGINPVSMGCDISKEGIRLAAKRYPASFFQVANIKERLPLADQALDLLLDIFAPRNVAEFARVVAPGALLLIVIPGPHHIQQLRSTLHLLTIEEQKEQHVIEQFASSFTLLTSEPVTYELTLPQEDLTRVVMMTPNYWHLTAEQRTQMAALSALKTTFDFRCLLFCRTVTP